MHVLGIARPRGSHANIVLRRSTIESDAVSHEIILTHRNLMRSRASIANKTAYACAQLMRVTSSYFKGNINEFVSTIQVDFFVF